MLTNMYMGFPFGAISVILHTILLFVDNRRSFVFYNASLFLWVCGNFLWMTIEFTDINPSSDIHLGPSVPIGGIPEHSIYVMTQVKTVMFLFGVIIQLSLYISIYCKKVPMPEQADEDIIIRNEVTLFLLGKNSYNTTKVSDVDAIVDLDDELPDYHELDTFHSKTEPAGPITLAFIENLYIVFWISKDLFWSFGTGDLDNHEDSIVIYEILAMCFGFTALCVYLVTAYMYRRKTLRFMDSLTTVFWISANYVWMCGEFFIRYDNLQYDDTDSGNDRSTRIASATLFCAGMLCQVYVVVVLGLRYRAKRLNGNTAPGVYAVTSSVPKVDMFSLKGIIQYQTLVSGFSPVHEPQSPGTQGMQYVPASDDDDEVAVLF